MITAGQKIAIQRTANSRLPGTDLENVKFGRVFSDHMVMMDFEDGAWKDPAIVPFADLELSPAALVLHYGQSIFEGLKAYRANDGTVNIFRPRANIARMNRSALRMCMPEIPEDVFLDALVELVRVDKDWIPGGEDASLYIRPFLFASDEYIGVKPSDNYKFIIFTCPVRGYYKEAVRVRMEQYYSRAFPGGTGATKCAGNYAAALYPAKLAQDAGYHQLLWTDGMEHKFIEESGTMNIFFNIGGTLVTPATSGTILEGITRDSIVQIARAENIPMEERKVGVAEVVDALRAGTLLEAFGAGTAATIAPIKSITVGDEEFDLPPMEQQEVALRVGKVLDDIRRGRAGDPFNWLVNVRD
ncbi:MAG: branched-chain amino acid aminotransferase [Flavobacteriales bacterium]|nr:branched-chain amino acid aminotransferase [Flavobacteriales bacterium]MCB9168017.1 branched-chain amino acid aminotransferase [Flavobacteriales bacterium]